MNLAKTLLVSTLIWMTSVTGCGNDSMNNSGGSGGSTTSGVRGQVTQGPIAPLSQAGQANTAPLPGAVITASNADGSQQVGSQTTDSSGNYQINLDPGTYQIKGLSLTAGLFPSPPAAQTVTISANQFVTVNLSYDTGIR